MNINRLEAALKEVNEIGAANGEGITRLAYSREHWEANEYLIRKCKDEGMSVRIDACGNVIARREGSEPQLPAVTCGSHLDTVQHGGGYDGTLGVIAGLEMIRSLNEKGIVTRNPIELISFACEESARFGVSTIGSKAMAGKLNKESLQKLRDNEGVSFPEALAAVDLDFAHIETARRSGKDIKAFFELHIEQGPLLENSGREVGIATGIAAPIRLEVTIQGKASHSGTTPMNMRKDALIGAAEIITELEKAALEEAEHGTVATAGVCDVQPGAMNVVPDWVSLKIDIRGTVITSRQIIIERLSQLFRGLQKRRGLQVEARILSDEKPVVLDKYTVRLLSTLCEAQGIAYMNMMSGAGHDAMNMASICPTGLIFIPSRDGLSHHKDEYSSIAQIAKGAALLEEVVLRCAEEVQKKPAGTFKNMDRSKHHESGKTKSII
ncbi:Zn-dependent hydrolase [Paenibacillus radicis (ex Xue et al. 2023)]|uniref:Zn-dependent hydrolase n=1 Tax=Paenibacillus radicis (ex Xue et al. 2023) TaxID=2972489 RepID=A0ABT1YT25_9BACL|nr:Zn-dependent hydrolase [Paenibacillus radicis (ex Xue et al. 2023)]MCR8635130.1 Zn-dependent hydrolase [Paenibacillus radicis (ex Xue et al. 2023)]